MKGQNVYTNPVYESRKAAGASCVFISHRLADLEVARAVADYLMNMVKVDIYFSDNDEELQQADQTNNHERIVEYIEGGLNKSTHLLGIISNQTKGSWWVPFEIGSARQRKTTIAQLLLEEVEVLPAYLKIAKLLLDEYDLKKWANDDRVSLKSVSENRSIDYSPIIPRVKDFTKRTLRFTQ